MFSLMMSRKKNNKIAPLYWFFTFSTLLLCALNTVTYSQPSSCANTDPITSTDSFGPNTRHSMKCIIGGNFTGKFMMNIDFQSCKMIGGLFTAAYLDLSNFYNTEITSCDFNFCLLLRSTLSYCGLLDVQLEYAQGDKVGFAHDNLWNVSLVGGSFVEASLENTILRDVRGQASIWTGAVIKDTRFEGCNFQNAMLQGVKATRWTMEATYLDGAILNGAEMKETTLGPWVHARSVSAVGVKADGSVWTKVDLTRADLSRASLRSASIIGCDLSEAWLPGADLSQANLTDSLFHRANLENASLVWVVGFVAINFYRANLRGVRGLPYGASCEDFCSMVVCVCSADCINGASEDCQPQVMPPYKRPEWTFPTDIVLTVVFALFTLGVVMVFLFMKKSLCWT